MNLISLFGMILGYIVVAGIISIQWVLLL